MNCSYSQFVAGRNGDLAANVHNKEAGYEKQIEINSRFASVPKFCANRNDMHN